MKLKDLTEATKKKFKRGDWVKVTNFKGLKDFYDDAEEAEHQAELINDNDNELYVMYMNGDDVMVDVAGDEFELPASILASTDTPDDVLEPGEDRGMASNSGR